ncbi:mechanosensitive ion channel family protein [Gluconobacter aidae]|uniref:Mechanosensitive ion channel n=1 Tax=Gluconobacter aidae TaxID=2662454 RepID=A0A7X1SNU1_9PROT|nr:mechanosensitive ion channel domain-containing protein [Gluconobacter aidae]MQR98183.1 mechanosensitive ion channel [Gluconobacter aidae]
MPSIPRPDPSPSSSARTGRAVAGIFLFLLLGVLTLLPARAADTAAPLNQQEAQQLLNVLNNPKERDAFTHTLSLMARGLQVETSAPAASVAAPAAAPAKPMSEVSPDIHTGLSSIRLQALGYLHNFLGLFSNLGIVGRWARHTLASADTRTTILHAFAGGFITMLCGVALERVVALSLRKPLRQLTQNAEDREHRATAKPDSSVPSEPIVDDSSQTRAADQRRQVETLRFLARVPYALGHFALKAIPVLAFLAVAYLAVLVLPWSEKTDNVIMTLANCYAAARILYLFVETGFAPRSPTIRLLPATDATAFLLTRWWNVLVAAPAIVFCLSTLGGQFNLSPRGTNAMIRGVVLIEHILIAIFIWRIRHLVSRALQPRNVPNTAMWTFLVAIARLWWVPAMFLDISLWIVWAAHLPGGYRWILDTTGITIGILVASRLVAVLAYGLQDRFFRINPVLTERFPDLQKRADRYYPFARKILTGVLLFLTLIAMTEAWGLPTFGFFMHNAVGRHLLDAALTMLIALSVAVTIWEIINALLSQQLNRFENSDQISRATRLRTVMPIIRTVLLAVIIIIVAVTTLSQIGINVTPLLTGAGIMGAAIAFGSQSLVKDFITGFFMLVEDAIQVGDWVTTSGVAGTVENLSIRTVKVRDFDGDLHIIPFSSVSSIANTARGYNQIVIRQQVDNSEDLPRVVGLMTNTIKEMQQDAVFGPLLLTGYNDLGVDTSDSNGAVLIGTVRTAPMMKWKVKREFYRRVANRFAEAGVKFYTPTSYSTTPPGNAMRIAADVTLPKPANDGPSDLAAGKTVPESSTPDDHKPA